MHNLYAGLITLIYLIGWSASFFSPGKHPGLHQCTAPVSLIVVTLSLPMVESIRTGRDKQQTSSRFYISSLNGNDPKEYAGLVRGHWGIENNLHRRAVPCQLDITFKEDNSQARKDNGPENLSSESLPCFCFPKKIAK